jgi:hypothetical protein
MPNKPLLLREPPASLTLGLGVAIGSVALCTAAIYPLKTLAPTPGSSPVAACGTRSAG